MGSRLEGIPQAKERIMETIEGILHELAGKPPQMVGPLLDTLQRVTCDRITERLTQSPRGKEVARLEAVVLNRLTRHPNGEPREEFGEAWQDYQNLDEAVEDIHKVILRQAFFQAMAIGIEIGKRGCGCDYGQE